MKICEPLEPTRESNVEAMKINLVDRNWLFLEH